MALQTPKFLSLEGGAGGLSTKIQDEAKLIPCLLHLCYNQNAGSSERFQSIAARLTRRFREEWLDNFFQVDALAFRAPWLLRVVFLDGQIAQEFRRPYGSSAANATREGYRICREAARHQ